MVAPSSGVLPPLAWLRAFGAAGRLGSFKRAARELHVTPSSISHQIRGLEAELGVLLFSRLTRAVVLTPQGEQYHRSVEQALALLQSATLALRASNGADSLRIGMLPATASEVFAPRLRAIGEALGGMRIEISSNHHLEALSDRGSATPLDAVVRFGSGAFEGMQCVKLGDVWLLPVCAPAWLAQHPIESPADLAEHTLVALNNSFNGWKYWSAAQGIELPADAEVVRFDDHLTAMRAVAQGVGVGLAGLPWLQSWLDEGMLVPVFDAKVRAPEASYLVFPRESARAARLVALGEWLAASLGTAAADHG